MIWYQADSHVGLKGYWWNWLSWGNISFLSYSRKATIRATARSTAAKSQAIFPQATTAQLEILEVPTLTSDHTAALKDAEASIHSASPVYGEGITG